MSTGNDLPEVFQIRDAVEADESFVFDSWIRSFAPAFPEMPPSLYRRRQHAVIERLFARPGTEIKVLCLREDPGVIVGWACIEQPRTVHYAFVKQAWRKQGLALALIRSVFPKFPKQTTYTHLPRSPDGRVAAIVERHLADHAVFDPYETHH